MASIRHTVQCLLILACAISVTCKSLTSKGNGRKQLTNKSRMVEDSHNSPQRISANINETVVLGCNLEFPDGAPVPYVIQWQKLNVKIPIFIWYDGYPPHTGDGYQGRTSLSGQASLQLSNVQESDQGWYECKVFFVNRPPELPKNGTWVHLDVHAPPHFKKRPPDVVYIKIGESVNLQCEAQATPSPVLTWFKDGRPLQESPNLRIFPGASELQIVNIQQSDIGEYTCAAKNREGSINTTTKLIIAGPAVITQQPLNLTKLEGEKAELSCEAKALPSNITYKWYFNGVSISQMSSLDSRAIIRQNGMLQIHPVSSEDTGIFTCEVFNGIGVPEMQSAYLNVQFPARVSYSPIVQYLPLGLSGIINCFIEANPPANQISWTKDGLPFEPSALNGVISLNNGSLLFQRVTMDNQGMYKCTPYNEYGTTPSGNQMEVLVKEPPVWTVKPNEMYTQQVNSELQVSCAGKGIPKPTVTFRRADNGKLPKDRTVIQGGNFTLKSLRKEDYGTYECVLANEIATLVSTFMILVDATTPHAPLNLQVNTSAQAATVTWHPSYDGGYEQTYTIWYRMADQGDSDWKSIRVYPEGSTTFTLYNLVANTFYEFQVYSRNILGEGLPSPILRAKTKDEVKLKPDPPRNVSIQRVSQGYAISWLKPLNSSVNISHYNIEYREGKDGESKFWGPITKENSYLAKLKAGESYRIRVFSQSPLGVGSPSAEIRIDVPGPVTRHSRDKAIAAGVVGGILFFVAAIVLSVCSVKLCNERKRRKAEKAYMMVTCPIMDARNGSHSHSSPVPLKQYAKSRISSLVSSLVNKIVAEFYYLTGYMPEKLKAKQAVFKAKQERAMNQLLKHHQEKPKSNGKISNKTVHELDRGGFDERWVRNRNDQMSFSNPTSQRTSGHNRSATQPVPPVRKSKLLSAAIVSNQPQPNLTRGSTTTKLIGDNSPVIATISSPNSTQTLQVRSHRIVHPSNDHHRSSHQTPVFTGHPSKLPISPIPYRPVHSNEFYNQQLRQFQSAPQLPMRYGPSSSMIHQPNTSTMIAHNQTFPATFESTPFLRDGGQVFARKSLPPGYFNRQQPQYLNAHSSRANQRTGQSSQAIDANQPVLPHSSTFCSPSQRSFEPQSPFDQSYRTAISNSFVPQQFVNNLNYDDPLPVQSLRQRSRSAPDQVNSSRLLQSAYLNDDQVPYFSPILDSRTTAGSSANFPPTNPFSHVSRLGGRTPLSPENTAFSHPSSAANFSYHHPSFASPSANIFPRRHPLINAAVPVDTTPAYYPRARFYTKNPYSDEFAGLSPASHKASAWLPQSPIGSDLHRIETINRMRLAQLAKERQRRRVHPSRSYPSSYLSESPFQGTASIMSDPFDKLNKSDLLDYLNYRDEQRLLDSRLMEERLLDKRLLEKRLLKQQSKRSKLLYADRLDRDDFEADAEDEIGPNGYVFHKSLTRRRSSVRLPESAAESRNRIVSEADELNPANSKIVAIVGTGKTARATGSLVDDYGISGNQNKSIADEEVAGTGEVKEGEPEQLGRSENKVNSSNGLSEEVSSSGRGSSNLDNSPKFSKLASSGSTTVVKSNSSSSGFASRTLSGTGSPDKCATPQQYNSDQFDKLSDKSPSTHSQPIKKKLLNETSEADENYEFDQLNSPQSNELEGRLLNSMLFKRNYSQPNLQRLRNLQLAAANGSLSAYNSPTSQLSARGTMYSESDKEDLVKLIRAQKQQRRIQQLKQQHRMEQQSLMSDENFDDYCFDLEDELGDRSRIDAAADEEIRQHLDHLVSRKQREFNSLREPAGLNYPNLVDYPLNSPHHLNQRNLAANFGVHRPPVNSASTMPSQQRNFNQQHRLNLLEQHSNRSFGSAPIRLDRAVFSDSELYEHQLSADGRTNFGPITNGTSAYQMSRRYLRRMRCEQLKEEFRRKYGERFKATNLETAC